MSDGCNEFSRSQFLRNAAALAGEGLPNIEPGMPMPAGTGLSRRSFLMRSGGLVMSVYGASKLNLWGLVEGTAQAAGPTEPVVVSVFLEGGIDSLSVLAPVSDGNYRRLRPTLALAEDAGRPFVPDPNLRWHPAADAFATLYDEDKLAVAPSVGYDHPDQSHFTSRHYWEVGELNAGTQTGWMGRYLDIVGTGDNPLQGLSLGGDLSPTLATMKNPVAAVSQPKAYRFNAQHVWGDVEAEMLDAFEQMGAVHADSPDVGMRAAGNAALQSGRLRRMLLPFATDEDEQPAGIASPVEYPRGDDEFPKRLAFLASMLQLGLPVRCAAVNGAGGYDTHDNQNDKFERDLKLTADSLLAFQRDLEARGLADRVIVQVWSEFGRRPEENGSRGTDHGAAGVAMVMGSRVKSQMLGEFTGVTQLDAQSNMRPSLDFRALHSAVLEQWLNVDAADIIPGAKSFAKPTLIG